MECFEEMAPGEEGSSTKTVRLKLLIDTRATRVIFGEADKEFVDFLFEILSLPIATVTRLLTKAGMVGSLGNLYGSVENLNEIYIQPNHTKDGILKPMVTSRQNVAAHLLPSTKPSSALIYGCSRQSSISCRPYVSDDPKALCPQCQCPLNRQLTFVQPQMKDSTSQGGGYVKGLVTYMVMDDLVVQPLSTISSITMLNKCNVKDVSALEEKVIDFTIKECVKLIEASLRSKTVLTDAFLKK